MAYRQRSSLVEQTGSRPGQCQVGAAGVCLPVRDGAVPVRRDDPLQPAGQHNHLFERKGSGSLHKLPSREVRPGQAALEYCNAAAGAEISKPPCTRTANAVAACWRAHQLVDLYVLWRRMDRTHRRRPVLPKMPVGSRRGPHLGVSSNSDRRTVKANLRDACYCKMLRSMRKASSGAASRLSMVTGLVDAASISPSVFVANMTEISRKKHSC